MTSFKAVTTPLTEMTWLHQISQNKDQIEINKNRVTKSIFCYENDDQGHNLTFCLLYYKRNIIERTIYLSILIWLFIVNVVIVIMLEKKMQCFILNLLIANAFKLNDLSINNIKQNCFKITKNL